MIRAPEHYTDHEAQRHATFQAATKGVSNWNIAKALNVLRPGHDYRGCTKGDMANTWSTEDEFLNFSGQELRDALTMNFSGSRPI